MTENDDLFDRLDNLVQRALDGEDLRTELDRLSDEARQEFEAMLEAQGGPPPMTPNTTETTEPRSSSRHSGSEVVAEFLEAYWLDRSEGHNHDLAYYLQKYPGDVEGLAHCYFALASQSSSTDVSSRNKQQIGTYSIRDVIGRGGQATVYLAEDQKLQREVALKVFEGANAIGKRALERFKREARAVSKLSHPNIGRIYEADVIDGLPYIAMELVSGESLAIEIDQRATAKSGDLPRDSRRDLEGRLHVLREIANALGAAHSAGVIHRDLKPANIMMRSDGSPVLLDFGLAKIEDDDALGITGTLDLLGTPAYIAPERLQNPAGKATRLEDIYALGVTAFEYITGKRPFQAPTVDELYRRKLRGDATAMESLIPGVSKDLAVVVRTAMELDPARRYQTAEQLAADLLRVIAKEPVSVRPIGAGLRMMRWYRRNALVATLALIVFCSLSVFAILTWKKNQHIESLRGEAVERGDALERSLDEVLELSDVKRVEDLIQESKTLWPIGEEALPRMESWLNKARDVVARSARHKAALLELEAHRLALTEADIQEAMPLEFKLRKDLKNRIKGYRDPSSGLSEKQAEAAISVEQLLESRTLEPYDGRVEALAASNFADAADSWRAELLTRLQAQLETLGDEDRGLIESILRRAELSKTIAKATVQDYEAAWMQAALELKKDPRFAGFELKPIVGLIPIGKDPKSGLQEFSHYLSRDVDEIPKRKVDGSLPELRPQDGLIMVLVPGGEFEMGAVIDPKAANYDPKGTDNEVPRHRVQLAPFFISKYEVWQGAWTRLAGSNPSAYQPGSCVRGTEIVNELHPVEFINWYDARAVLRRFNMELPTEAQWEFAARAGQDTIWCFGNDPMKGAGRINIIDDCLAELAGENSVGPSGIGKHNDGYALHGPVNLYDPNAFGLYQVEGNVYEWCLDSFGTYKSPVRKGDGFRLGTINNNDMRMFRGGAYGYSISQARLSARSGTEAASPNEVVGLRPIIKIPREAKD